MSAAGVVAQSFTSDHIGPMARRVEDLAAIMAVIAGPDPTCLEGPPPDFLALGPANLAGLRVGVIPELMTLPLQPGVTAGFQAALSALEGLEHIAG